MNFDSKFLVTSAKLPQHHSSDFRGLGIVVEWPKDSVRVGEDKNGKKWHRKMEADYGYIPNTTAAGDKEGLDVYIGPDEDSENVYVVEQLKDDGEFDEYKVLLGFPNLDTAYETYLKHYPEGWDDTNVGSVSEVPFEYVFDKVEEHQEGQGKTAKTTLPPYLYHGSPRVHMEDNLAHGLRIKHSTSHNEWDGGAIYLASDEGSAAMYPDHIEPGETNDKVVYRVDTKYLNKLNLRPDDADFPDVFANMTEEEIEDAKARFGDDFDEDNWAFCEWPVSLYLSGQVAYIADIPPQALKVVRNKTANTAPGTYPSRAVQEPRATNYEHYVWVSCPFSREDHIMRGQKTDHTHFCDQRYYNPPLSIKEYDNSTRGYAEVKNDSKVVILTLSPVCRLDFLYFPPSIIEKFKEMYPGYKIYTGDGKMAGIAYLNALTAMRDS